MVWLTILTALTLLHKREKPLDSFPHFQERANMCSISRSDEYTDEWFKLYFKLILLYFLYLIQSVFICVKWLTCFSSTFIHVILTQRDVFHTKPEVEPTDFCLLIFWDDANSFQDSSDVSINLLTHLCLKCHLYAGILKYSKSKANTLNGNLIITIIILIEFISGGKKSWWEDHWPQP